MREYAPKTAIPPKIIGAALYFFKNIARNKQSAKVEVECPEGNENEWFNETPSIKCNKLLSINFPGLTTSGKTTFLKNWANKPVNKKPEIPTKKMGRKFL